MPAPALTSEPLLGMCGGEPYPQTPPLAVCGLLGAPSKKNIFLHICLYIYIYIYIYIDTHIQSNMSKASCRTVYFDRPATIKKPVFKAKKPVFNKKDRPAVGP